MSTTLTEPPVKVNPEDFAHLLGGENPLAACQEKKAFGPEAPQGLMARLMMKSYLSALN